MHEVFEGTHQITAQKNDINLEEACQMMPFSSLYFHAHFSKISEVLSLIFVS